MNKENIKVEVERFGEKVFNVKTMRNYLSETAYKSLMHTIRTGSSLDPEIADEVADSMKMWAVENGATHYTHWFQPLHGSTAEKHEAFFVPDNQGGALLHFSGKELIKGEPDASSFPSGGLRSTFEARGYTGWDPTSPAFIKTVGNASTLCIPSVFCGYHGEALDKKTPLLRSMDALSRQVCRLGKLFGIESENRRACATLGAEQEYFLIDREVYEQRLDLAQTGRTLFGREPAKHQQMEDHYFGAIKPRILRFMSDLDQALWSLGIPAKTRHNEVCPGQFEIAPYFEELNLAVDHNMMTMEVLRETADRHGLACLLHEKPFAGVNGSGKHNNWAIRGPDGRNWLTPGDDPQENAAFLVVICALMMAVDRHASLLRATVASSGNDHRLGANEAPPAIMSIFLGDQLSDIIERIGSGDKGKSQDNGFIEIGVSSLPRLPRDATDRNRTSPLAFTGNKFEFRAVGSNQSCAGPNVVLNTIVAEALDDICSTVEKKTKAGTELNDAIQDTLQDVVRLHKKVIFNGDNYTDEWIKQAKERGLPNLKKTPEALEAIVAAGTIATFGKYNVLSDKELQSRYEVYLEAYKRSSIIEATCATTMARTMILPAAIRYQELLANTISAVEESGVGSVGETRAILAEVCQETDSLLAGIRLTETDVKAGDCSGILAGMQSLRTAADRLEDLLPDDLWPLPSYAEMLFLS